MSNKPRQLTPAALARYRIFAASWVGNGHNGTQAAIDAGFSPRCAAQQAIRLLKRQDVLNLIEPLERKVTEHYEMTADSVMKELGAIVHFDMRKLYRPDGSFKDVSELDDETAHALASMEIVEIAGEESAVPMRTKKLKGYDKVRAIELAMKHYKLLDGSTVTINQGVVVLPAEAWLCC